jgi:Spy/CpxP family protein refolding chaperone
MDRTKWYALAFLIGAFIAGAAVGVAGDRTIEHRYPREGPRRPMDRMSRELNLTASQRAAFDSILDRRETQIQALYAPIRPQLDSLNAIGRGIKDSTHEQLRRVLNDEQRAKFDKMRAEFKKRGDDARHRRNRGPGPDSGPGRR